MVSKIKCLAIASVIALATVSGAFAFEQGGTKLTGKPFEYSPRDYRPFGSGIDHNKRDESPFVLDEPKHYEDKEEGQPDLVPNDFKVNKVTLANKKNECEFSINVRVKNIGTATAGKSKLDMKVDNKVAKTKAFGSLKAKKTSSKKTITGKVVGLGRHKITVVADAKGAVAESKEGNNSETKTIECKKK